MLHECGTETQVKDSRPRDGGVVRRRRFYPYCRVRFTTYEIQGEHFGLIEEFEKIFISLKRFLGK